MAAMGQLILLILLLCYSRLGSCISASFQIAPFYYSAPSSTTLTMLSGDGYIEGQFYGNLVNSLLTSGGNSLATSGSSSSFTIQFSNGVVASSIGNTAGSGTPDSYMVSVDYDGTNLTLNIVASSAFASYTYNISTASNTSIVLDTQNVGTPVVINIAAYGYVGPINVSMVNGTFSTSFSVPYTPPIIALYPPISIMAFTPVSVLIPSLVNSDPITYAASRSGSLITAVVSSSVPNYDTWLFTPPANTFATYAIIISNGGSVASSSIVAYAPSVSSTYGLPQGSSVIVTVNNAFSQSSYTVSDTAALSTINGTVSTVTFSPPGGYVGTSTWSFRQGANAAVAVFTVTSSMGVTLGPPPAVFGGNSVTVSVTQLAYPGSSITYLAYNSTDSIASTVSPSDGTTWSFQAPPNKNGYVYVNVSNGNAYTVASIVETAPIINYISTIGPTQTKKLTISNLSSPGSFTVYSGAASLSQQTVISPIIVYTAPNTMGMDTITVSQGLNSFLASFTVTNTLSVSLNYPTSVPAGEFVTAKLKPVIYSSSITFTATAVAGLISSTVVNSDFASFVFTAPANTSGRITVFVTNGPASYTTTITAYTPTFVQSSSSIPAGIALYPTILSLDTSVFLYTAVLLHDVNTSFSSIYARRFSTISVPISSSYTGLYTLQIAQNVNTIGSVYTVVAIDLTVVPTPTVFGGESVTADIGIAPYASNISYAAVMTGSTFASTVVPPNSPVWSFQAPTNSNQSITVLVSNGPLADSAGVTDYAPTLPANGGPVTGSRTFVATVTSLNQTLSYSATFCGYSTTLTGPSSIVTISVPTTSCDGTNTLTINQGSNQATATYSVQNLFFSVSPTPSVNGGQVVSVTVQTLMTAEPLTYAALLNGTTLASNVSASTQTTWSFLAPTNMNAPVSITVINDVFSAVSTVSLYAPTVATTNNGIIMPVGQLVVTPTGINTAYPYTVSFGNGIYSFVNTIAGTSTAFTLPVPRNYIGQFVLTIDQSPNEGVVTYTVTNARPAFLNQRPGALVI